MLIPKPKPHSVDTLAARLIYLGRLARRMPPSWDGAAISHPVCGLGGQFIGRLLPGRGLYLDIDPTHVGLTRGRLPFVFPKTPVQRLADWFGRNERMAIAAFNLIAGFPFAAINSYDQIIRSRANGKTNDVSISKASYTTVANVYSSVYRAGGFPVAGTYANIPGGAAHDRASTGAWSQGLTNPTAPDKKYLLTFGYGAAQQINMAILADLLVAAGNINANATGNQTISSTALTRQYGATQGAGVLMTYEVTTALGGTASNLTVNSYTDQDGNTGATTPAVAMTTSAIVQRLQPAALGPYMELASGDYGVRSVETLVFSAAMAAGVVALNLYFPLAFVPGVAANSYIERDSTVQVDGLIELAKNGSDVIGCLMAYVLTNTTSTGVLTAFLRGVAG